MLAVSKPGAAYAGVDVARGALDPASLAEMAWTVFESWRNAGYPAEHAWLLDGLGLVGDDETARSPGGPVLPIRQVTA